MATRYFDLWMDICRAADKEQFFFEGHVRRMLLRFLLGVLLLLPLVSHGAPYGEEGKATRYRQPDGSVVELRVFGDEFYAITETVDGYVLVFDSSVNAYCYAVLSANNDELLSSGIMVRSGDNPAAMGFKKNIRINTASRRAKAKKNFKAYDMVVKQTEAWNRRKSRTRDYREKNKQTTANAQTASADNTTGVRASSEEPAPEYASPETTGGKVGITILVDFPDETATIDAAEIDDYFNKPGYSGYGNNGSIFDYFYTQSARKLRYNNTVTYYVRMQLPKSYYNDTSLNSGTCGRRLLEDALDILTAAGFDFSACTTDVSGNIEACNLLFAGADSGVWAQGLWPHRWVLSDAYNVGGGMKVYDYQMTDINTSLTIGTVCHETGHMLCKYPDFYDYDYDSRGCGKYTLMASGNHYYQTSPISVGAYLRYQSGWVDIVQLTPSMNERCSVRVDEGRIYMYDNPDVTWPGEYFLLENRAKIGWEASSGLPDQGLLIMHCDEDGDRDSQEMTESQHYECSIEQADNAFDLEHNNDSGDAYDLFHSGGTGPNTTFNDGTGPNAHWWGNATTSTTSGDDSDLDVHTVSSAGETMTFIVGSGMPTGTREIGVDQSAIYMEANYGQVAASVSFAVWNKQSGTLSYSISDDAAWMSVSPASGTASTESDVIDISFELEDGLAAGTYDGTITVSDSGASNSPQTIAVQLVVFSPPEIGVSASSFAFSGYSGAVAGTQQLKISNAGGGAMDYALSNNSTWLSLSASSGTVVQEEDLIDLTFDATTLSAGTYYDTVTVVSASAGNSPYPIAIEFEVLDGPIVSVDPDNIALLAVPGATDSTALVISNSGGSDLTFSISDDFPPGEYSWLDSDDVDGPVYSWIDISALGSAVTLSDDGESSMLSIGFDFPFYDSVYNQFQIGANGVISFSSGNLHFTNAGLPSSDAPSQSLMPFWDDLNPGVGGSIRYHGTAERLVVSWLGVPRYGTSDYETFQVVIYPDGRIVYQYNDLNGSLASCTVGLQADNSTGPYIEMAYSESYLKNSFAIEVVPTSDAWLTYPVANGTVSPSASVPVWFNGSASNLTQGIYTALVTIAFNDIDHPEVDFPAVFTVSSDIDGDGIPNRWETRYYGGPTNANPAAICANGVNTVLEAYIAGLNPTNPLDAFVITGFNTDTNGTGNYSMQWNEARGRVYTIYWSSNLLFGFTPLQADYAGGAFTDTVHSADSEGFYRIEVEIAP